MTAVQPGPPHSPPDGRYGPGADARADRGLRIAAVVLGVLAAAGIVWYGWHYVTGTGVSGQVVSFRTVSDRAVEIHLEVHKDPDAVVVCTLRSEDAEHNEVGRKDVTVSRRSGQVDTIVTLRTTARGQTGELVHCGSAPRG
ncbi:DUF4307 domain-containing protein [Streptomyces sp.]|uniref:DUF4307 domain-containing protein n=1 Tax=Streptomyces sp. TaxID=1931 RepID=UPI002F42F7D0